MKPTQTEARRLKLLATKLPVVLSDSHEKHLVKGADILEWNTVTEIEDEPIDPERMYLWHYPVQMYHNHHRRIKRAFRKDGMLGVYRYVETVNEIIAQNIAAKSTENAMAAFSVLSSFLNK